MAFESESGEWAGVRCGASIERLVIEDRPLWAEAYAKAICSFDICLGFLNKTNRDLQTRRTVEIPACQGFLLAERTSEQLGLFEEGQGGGVFRVRGGAFAQDQILSGSSRGAEADRGGRP